MGDVVRPPPWAWHRVTPPSRAVPVRPCGPRAAYPWVVQRLPAGGVALLTPDGAEHRLLRQQARELIRDLAAVLDDGAGGSGGKP